jgi:hypothetical protein
VKIISVPYVKVGIRIDVIIGRKRMASQGDLKFVGILSQSLIGCEIKVSMVQQCTGNSDNLFKIVE